jgi:acyl carrier protein
LVADAIRLPRADVHDDTGFFEYGVDSLIAVRLVNRINRAFGVSLRSNTLFEHGSVAKLARYICELRENSAGSLAATRQRR